MDEKQIFIAIDVLFQDESNVRTSFNNLGFDCGVRLLNTHVSIHHYNGLVVYVQILFTVSLYAVCRSECGSCHF